MNSGFLLTILVLAVTTWLTRALPFIFLSRRKKAVNFGQGRLQILGPALLLSTTVVVLTSEVNELLEAAIPWWPFAIAVLAVILISYWRRNIGLSVLFALFIYGHSLMLS